MLIPEVYGCIIYERVFWSEAHKKIWKLWGSTRNTKFLREFWQCLMTSFVPGLHISLWEHPQIMQMTICNSHPYMLYFVAKCRLLATQLASFICAVRNCYCLKYFIILCIIVSIWATLFMWCSTQSKPKLLDLPPFRNAYWQTNAKLMTCSVIYSTCSFCQRMSIFVYYIISAAELMHPLGFTVLSFLLEGLTLIL